MSARFSFSYYSCCYLCLFFVAALFHLCSSNQKYDDVLCMDGERQALLEFKHGLIDETNRLGSWVGEESDCCKWVGIVCDNYTGHVSQIHLAALEGRCVLDYGTIEYKESFKHRLKGNLSSSLVHLKQLQHLDLSCNDFGGMKVPEFIGSLESLRYLNLSNSRFSGTIPPQLGNLTNLRVLCLLGSYESSMMNMQWLSSLRFLHHLDMSGVDLSKATDWLQVMNTLPSLAELFLIDCQLSRIYPHVSSLNFTSLSLLGLSYNKFNSIFPRWILNITSLILLDLSGCNLYAPIPSSMYSFRDLTSLEWLFAGGNDFMNSSIVLKELSSSLGNNLILLDISSCGVSSSVLDSLHNLTSLLGLYLSENQLTKIIPKSLCNFCNLKEIELSENDFSTVSLTYLLESFFECKAPALESLFMSNSGLSGHLPASIGWLSLLRMMVLDNNQLNGSLPDSIGQLSSLKVLDFSYNQLDGSLPISIGQLSKLERLDLSYNFFKGVVTEAHFAKLVSLKYLNGKGNKLILRPRLENWIPPFKMQYLYLNSWNLGPQFPVWLQSQISDLEDLDISNTYITEDIPESIWRSFTNINCLDMSKNRIRGTLSSIPATLRLLDLSFNEFSGKLTHLSNSSLPISLDLSSNSFTGSVHHLLCSNGVKQTQLLNLGNNSLSGVIPECWEKWPRLIFLNLENNNFFGEIPRTLGSLSYLRSLNMRGNNISGILHDSLMNLTNLEILQLGRNELVGRIPTSLGLNLPFLGLLNLRSNNFDGNIPHHLCYLTTVQILDLADNNLSGNIPRCFHNFTVLSGKENISTNQFSFYIVFGGATIATDLLVTKGREDTYGTILPFVMLLDLSSNNLTGHIPSELTTLVKLNSLNLSRNQLTGRIPKKIGNLKSLESFDVSLNKLYGELPMSLSGLNSLSSFNVSYNNLTGRVPTSTQLQSLNESSFFGNNLCGAPLTKSCAVKVPDMKDQDQDDGSHGTDWGLIISTVFGLIAGFWIVVIPLIVSRSWRIAYFHFFTELKNKFF